VWTDNQGEKLMGKLARILGLLDFDMVYCNDNDDPEVVLFHHQAKYTARQYSLPGVSDFFMARYLVYNYQYGSVTS